MMFRALQGRNFALIGVTGSPHTSLREHERQNDAFMTRYPKKRCQLQPSGEGDGERNEDSESGHELVHVLRVLVWSSKTVVLRSEYKWHMRKTSLRAC
jgi:hypothetical protein